jgi:hypothetical protein
MLDSVGASTKEVYWLPGTELNTEREQVLKLCRTSCILAQQETRASQQQ